MKTNYQLETDKCIAGIGAGRKPTLLLHSCCGPCSSYVLEYLTRYFDVTVLYYNPNVQPEEEYEKRLHYQREVLKHIPARLMECPYDGPAFEAAACGYEDEPEGGARCTRCFQLRLEETARRAAEHGFDWYCTTLTVSPHKDAERINRIGRETGGRWGVRWLPSDFKKRDGYLRSIRLSEEYGLYRQDWCGCGYSRSPRDGNGQDAAAERTASE